jgi:phosphoribosylanthranilate isomerase
MIVQIYEIQTPREAEKCILLGVDRLGSVLISEEEWKQPGLRDVIRLSEGTRTQNSILPLFQTKDTLYRAMDYYRPHFIHFCENLTDDSCRMLDTTPFINQQREFKEKFPEIRILRSLPVPEQGAKPEFPVLEIAAKLRTTSDAFLIDTWLGKPPVDGFIGITGKLADRELSRKLVYECSIPVLLAGGLSPDNVYDAILEVMPAGADSCSHTNLVSDRGRPLRFCKDFEKVDTFVREVRRAETFLQEKKSDLERKIRDLNSELKERQAALPAHSVRPHQFLAIEELEEKILSVEKELMALRWA